MTRVERKHNNLEDAALFRQAIVDAKPINQRRIHLARIPPRPKARFRRRDEQLVLRESMQYDPEILDVETGEELSFRRNGISTSVMRMLRTGRYVIQGELDLHGLNIGEARAVTQEFLTDAADRGQRCVRIIHGKGLRSGAKGPVLKASVNRWLRQWDQVLAFCSAPRHDGGTGAIYVLIKRRSIS